jgi:hypothetical protein
MSRLFGLLGLMLLAFPASAGANEVVLRLANGGEMRGQLLNPDVAADKRENYELQTPFGGKFAVGKAMVVEVVKVSAPMVEYERIRPTFPDTVDGQWALAQWCREQQLMAQRTEHLRRIIDLEPNHERARSLLGYMRVDGEWVTRESLMEQRGYVKSPRGWELPQEVQLREERRKREQAEREWFARLNMLRSRLDSAKADDARRVIASITDPHALRAMQRHLDHKNEKNRDVRLDMVEGLVSINTSAAHALMVERALFDVDSDVRITCMEKLGKIKNYDVVRMFIGYLRDSAVETVNRAALGLAYMHDPSAISPLIDALITVHVKVTTSGSANQHAATFGSGGQSNFASGGTATKHVNKSHNEQVRATLADLTGVDFAFDKEQWRTWYNAQRKAGNVDARRD